MTPEPKALASDLDAAVGRVSAWANYPFTTPDQIAVRSPISTFTAADLRLILSALADANVEIIGLRADVEAAHAIGRQMIAARDAALSSQSQAAEGMAKALEQVMSWISNWDPNFIYDPAWPADADEARTALSHYRTLGDRHVD